MKKSFLIYLAKIKIVASVFLYPIVSFAEPDFILYDYGGATIETTSVYGAQESFAASYGLTECRFPERLQKLRWESRDYSFTSVFYLKTYDPNQNRIIAYLVFEGVVDLLGADKNKSVSAVTLKYGKLSPHQYNRRLGYNQGSFEKGLIIDNIRACATDYTGRFKNGLEAELFDELLARHGLN